MSQRTSLEEYLLFIDNPTFENLFRQSTVQEIATLCGLTTEIASRCEPFWPVKYEQLYEKEERLYPNLPWKQNLLEMGVVVFGKNKFGQLGLGDTEDRNIPERISNFLYPKIIYISAGLHHTVCIDENGNVWTFGKNNFGQLGLGRKSEKKFKPQQISPESFQLNGRNVRITQVSAGFYHTVCLDEDRNVWTFGWNNDGQLGLDSDTKVVYTPHQVTKLPRITQISAGENHTVCLDEDGNVWTFGWNDFGQLGLRFTSEKKFKPQQISPESFQLNGRNVRITQVSAGGHHTMCIDKDGHVWAFGSNVEGQLGLGAFQLGTGPFLASGEKIDTPQQIAPDSFRINGQSVKIVRVSAGGHHTVFIDDRGNVWLLGRLYKMTEFGKQADALASPRRMGRKAIPPNIIQVSAGGEHTVLLGEDMSVWTLGVPKSPQVGGTSAINEIKNKALQVSAGWKHTVLIGF